MHALLLSHQLNAAANTLPPVVFSVEPEEDGALVHLPIVAQLDGDAASSLFGLRVQMQNNGSDEVRLTAIRITFTHEDNAVLAYQFERDLVIASGKSATSYLSPDDPAESIRLFEPVPVSARIDLFFDGYDAPKTVERKLAPYTSPTAGGRYLFPGNAADLEPDQYFSHVEPHTGGSQFFGYDLHVQGWNGKQFSSIKPGGDPDTNEGRLAWNVPIYAMAEGVVLRASIGWEDNPAPGLRAVQPMAEQDGEPIADVKVTELGASRTATVARLPSGSLKITVWDFNDDGREIIRRGSVVGESVTDVATDALTGSRLVTAVRTSAGILRLIVWQVSTDGTSLTRLSQTDAGPIKELAVTRVSSSRFATAVRTSNDLLRVTVWDVSGDGLTVAKLDEALAGAASSISIVALTASRLVASCRTAEGTLKVIVWDIEDDTTLVRRGDATADPITKAAAAKLTGTQVATAMRTATGHLKVIQWTVSADGETVTKEREATAGMIQDLAAPATGNFSGSDNILTPIITQTGNYKHILWRQPNTGSGEDPDLLQRCGERDAGPVTRLSIDTPEAAFFVSATRTSAGDLKVITWRAGGGGGNSLVILHGNCRVLYAHFRNGSVSPAVAYPGARVAPGQFLGRMGNSGRSAGPHLHIHAERVPTFLTVEEAIDLEAANALPRIAFRPIPFHCARAMRLDALQPGGEANSKNAFSTLSGHGVYFAQYAIRPTWLKEMYVDSGSNCLAPAGRKDCQPLGPVSVGGPFPSVQQALSLPCWGHQLFIRGGSYPETVTFDRSMTVRSYDGTAVVGQ
jgi:hypothetical protein